jgi:hypothetical protein
MAEPGKYSTELQRLLLMAYKSTALGDESLGAALSAADASGRDVGSGQLVQSWRMGRCAMPVGALEVTLDHAGDEHAGRLLDALCRRYGFVAVRLPEASTARGLRRAMLLAGAAAGAVQAAYVAATAEESDEGEALTAAELEEIGALLDREIHQLMACRTALKAGA